MEELDFAIVRDNIKKVKGKRSHSVVNSCGVYDAYKYARKNKWFNIGRPVTEKEYYAIIRTMNKYLRDDLLSGEDIIFPYNMGKIQLLKTNRNATYKDGKLVNNYPIDWDKTLKLWHEDKDAFANKVLVKMPEHVVFKIYYNKQHSNYNNQMYYHFKPNRELKILLKDKVKDNKIDAFTISY